MTLSLIQRGKKPHLPEPEVSPELLELIKAQLARAVNLRSQVKVEWHTSRQLTIAHRGYVKLLKVLYVKQLYVIFLRFLPLFCSLKITLLNFILFIIITLTFKIYGKGYIHHGNHTSAGVIGETLKLELCHKYTLISSVNFTHSLNNQSNHTTALEELLYN